MNSSDTHTFTVPKGAVYWIKYGDGHTETKYLEHGEVVEDVVAGNEIADTQKPEAKKQKKKCVNGDDRNAYDSDGLCSVCNYNKMLGVKL